LEAAYTRYRDRQIRAGRDPLSPEAWVRRQTQGAPRDNAEVVFGSDFRHTGAAAGPRPAVRLGEIARPAAYGDVRLQADLTTVRDHPGLWQRLSALRRQGVSGGEVHPSLLNILRGNIGEILAQPVVRAALDRIRLEHPDAALIPSTPGGAPI